jgi:predicted RNA-binding protein Jag
LIISRSIKKSGNSSGVERCLAKAKVAGSNPVSRSKKYLFLYWTQDHFMKSIIEQASSIMKAIEKAWDQAEKPKEFSIKIFEQEERNFFGMSTKPAKIGIFFDDKPTTHEKTTTAKPRQEIKECRPEIRKNKQHKTQPDRPTSTLTTAPVDNFQTKPLNGSNVSEIPHKPEQQDSAPKPLRQRRIPSTWNDDMIAAAHKWLRQTLLFMDMPSIDFTSEVAGKNLKLTFNVPLIPDVMHEKQLFRSFAHLIISSLRNQYKQEIRDLKVVLIRPEQ